MVSMTIENIANDEKSRLLFQDAVQENLSTDDAMSEPVCLRRHSADSRHGPLLRPALQMLEAVNVDQAQKRLFRAMLREEQWKAHKNPPQTCTCAVSGHGYFRSGSSGGA